MNDDELKKMVAHLAKIHNVTTEHMVAEISGEDPPEVESADTRQDGETEAATETPKKRGGIHWTAVICSLVVVGVLVGIVIIGGMKFLNGPAEAKAGTTSTQEGVTPTPVPKSNELTGLYIDLTYPGEFDQVQSVKSNQAALEQFNITSLANYRRQISISVFPLPSGHLKDDSSYEYRVENPSLYTQTASSVDGEPVALMTKSDNTEQTLFWSHDGKELIIAITSTDPTDNVKSFMASIMPTLRWKQ